MIEKDIIINQGCSDLRGGFDYKIKTELSALLALNAKQDGEFYSSAQALDALDRFIEKECNFYTLMIDKLVDMMSDVEDFRSVVLLWDVDNTLTQYGKHSLRPGFSYVSSTIKQLFPGIIFGICSARAQDHLDSEFYHTNYYGFNSKFIFSAKGDFDQIQTDLQSTRGSYESSGHYQKVNSYRNIQQRYPNYQFILIDDIIGPQFEQQKKGIIIPRSLCYGGELNLQS